MQIKNNTLNWLGGFTSSVVHVEGGSYMFTLKQKNYNEFLLSSLSIQVVLVISSTFGVTKG